MSPRNHPLPSPFTPAERAWLRQELGVHFGAGPQIADGLFLRSWKSGPEKGKPKLLPAARSMLYRGAERGRDFLPEIDEPAVILRTMTTGREVVEDYGHVGLTLRDHPVAFLRGDLHARRIVTCAEAMQARDGRRLETAGLVLVRQRPGSAKGVMFITLKD